MANLLLATVNLEPCHLFSGSWEVPMGTLAITFRELGSKLLIFGSTVRM